MYAHTKQREPLLHLCVDVGQLLGGYYDHLQKHSLLYCISGWVAAEIVQSDSILHENSETNQCPIDEDEQVLS